MKLLEALEKFIEYLAEEGGGVHHLKTVRGRVGHFIKNRQDDEVATVTRAELALFITTYKETHADGTVAGMVASHRQFWRYCKKKKWVKRNPAKRLKSYSYAPVLRKPPPEEDVEKVAACLAEFVNHRGQRLCDVRDALFVSLSLDCGGRRGAMLKLKRSEVVKALEWGRPTDNGRTVYLVTVNRDKTGAVTLEFFDETAALFRLWFELCPARPRPGGSGGGARPDEGIFISMWTGKAIHPDTVSRSFIRVCKFAGVPTFRPHGVRKRNGREMIKNSDARTAQGYTGHKDIKTLLIHYNPIEEKDVHNAAAEMASRRRGNSKGDKLARALFGSVPGREE